MRDIFRGISYRLRGISYDNHIHHINMSFCDDSQHSLNPLETGNWYDNTNAVICSLLTGKHFLQDFLEILKRKFQNYTEERFPRYYMHSNVFSTITYLTT